MAKFTLYVNKTETYMVEIEAKTANEAESIYWDNDDLGKLLDGSAEFKIDEVHVNGELLPMGAWDKEYK